MFQVISLGHHGWLFRTPETTIAVDPLLGDRFAFTRDLIVWPERALTPERFPKLHALFLTHEHEGHFDPYTLSLLARDTPVWIPSRSSAAMQLAIEEMGFVVHRARAGAPLVVGDLELFPMAADQIGAAIEEWDVLAYIVRDLAGHGSFFTHVDMPPTEHMREQALARLGRPGLWAVTANDHQYAFQTSWRLQERAEAFEIARRMAAENKWFEERGAPPAGLLLVGGGFAFAGELAWLNRNAFPVDLDAVARAVAAVLPHRRVERALAGQSWTFLDGAIVAPDADVAPVALVAPDVGVQTRQVSDRTFVGDVDWLEDYAPACGRMTLAAGEMALLEQELARFAAALYGGRTFRALHALQEAELGLREPTFALVLRADEQGGAYVFAYSSQDCAFLPVAPDLPTERYLAVYECWATDLLDSFLVRQSQNDRGFGRCRSWNAEPERFQFDLELELFVYVHPLRFPDRFLDLYRRRIAAL